jgi:formylglycine-generating enzyme required for sulfatase activity
MIDTIPQHKVSIRQIVLFLTAIILTSISIHFFWTLANRFATFDPNPIPGDNPMADGPQATMTTLVYQQTLESGVSGTQTAQAPTPTPTFSPTPSPTASPTPSATPKHAATRVSPIDHMVSVYIPAGIFKMGVNGDGRTDGPQHKVNLDAFWMNRTPVTNAMYAKCVHAGGCNNPIRKAINPNYYDSAYANHPVVYVTWFDAQKYCKWVGGQLPTEAQWERAASDNGRRTYPWGNTNPQPDLANVNNFYNTTTKVGSHPAGASPFGVLDLGGDVREWVYDWYSPTYYKNSPTDNPIGPAKGELKVLRGASWNDPIVYSRVSSRLSHFPGSAGENRGFRCALSQ